MLRTRWLLVLLSLAFLGCTVEAGEFFGENLVTVKLTLPKGDTYIRGTTNPVANLVAEVALTNVTEKEKLTKETVSVTTVGFLSSDELIALTDKLKKEATKEAILEMINAETEKKKATADKDVFPVNQKSIGVAYPPPELGPHEVINFVITKLPEEGAAVPEGAKPVIIPRDNKPDHVGRVDWSPVKYLAAGENSPVYSLPVGEYYRISEAGLYSIKAVLLTVGDSNKPQKLTESNEEKFRVLPFKKVDQKIDELRRNWEFYERGYPSFEYMLYQVVNGAGYDEVYWVQRIMVRGSPRWEWERVCTVKGGTLAQVAFLGPKKYAVMAVQAKGDGGLYTLDFNTVGPTLTTKAFEVKEGTTPKLKVEAGVPAVE
ncbi:MAG: hypothetical protein NTW87_13190 [Planctomycetota bacterium]|nr:hypothetical protein [Planctomycetota bacterium]